MIFVQIVILNYIIGSCLMLQSYLFPIKYAFLAFPFAAFLFTLPFLIVQYRKHGYINKFRGVIKYLFLLYLMNAC